MAEDGITGLPTLGRRVAVGAAAAALTAAAMAAPALAAEDQKLGARDGAEAAGRPGHKADHGGITLRVKDKDGRVRARKKVRFVGRITQDRHRHTILFQERTRKKGRKSWKTLKKIRDGGRYSFRHRITEGRHAFRTALAVPGKNPASTGVRVLGTAPDDFTGMVMPADADQVVSAVSGAKQSVEIVIYDFGAQDIVSALQAAKARLAQNKPTSPVIRVMVNNQWWSQRGAASHYSYVAKAAKALGVGSNGRSADGVVQFNYTANNFSLTHQKAILIDTLRPDGSEYGSAAQLPPTARAIVATFNLNAYGWDQSSTGCENNPDCSFAGGTPGTRDFGIVANDPEHVYEVQQVYSSDWNGPSPEETNEDLGLDDPDSNLVWSNGTSGILFPAPTGVPNATGALFSKATGSYPAWQADSGVGNGFYPSPYYRFYDDAEQYPQVQLGKTEGNANQVHLNIIRAAESAAEDGKPAALYIYNEEYADDQVLYAIQDAAAAGVQVRIIMTYSSGNIRNYDELLNTTLKAPGRTGQPVDVQIHLFPNETPPYMYIHAKMVYADIGSDLVFVGSQNFSENSLLYNREGGVQLKQSDGTLTPRLRSMLLGTFNSDLALTGAGNTWTHTDGQGGTRTDPCPVVVGTPADTLTAQSKNLFAGDQHAGGAGAGCQLGGGSAALARGPDPDTSPDLSTDATTPESWLATSFPDFGSPPAAGASPSPSPSYPPTFADPLFGVGAEYHPPMPQGPIDVDDMVPGACQVVDQATGNFTGAQCPAGDN